MSAYYNEIDPFAAEWLRRLILFGHIAPGDVDERSIEDVSPDDLIGYRQCHFFAGIGVWSAALRGAGWEDDREVWTGSCPCQPFSGAGKGGGFTDERHLWPAWFHLIRERRPRRVFGEQVSDRGGPAWLDLVQADMEGEDFAFGALGLCSAGFGGSDRRHRSYFVGYPLGAGLEGRAGRDNSEIGRSSLARPASSTGGFGGVAYAESNGRIEGDGGPAEHRAARQLADAQGERGGPGSRDCGSTEQRGPVATDDGDAGGLAHGHGERQPGRPEHDGQQVGPGESASRRDDAGRCGGADGLDDAERDGRGEGRGSDAGHERVVADATGAAFGPGPVNGFWRSADWISCRDQRWRPVEPGTFPLAHGVASRVGLLRGYGNAINKEVAQGFIEAAMTCVP